MFTNEIILKINEKKQSNNNIVTSLKLYLDGLEEVINLLQNSVTDIKIIIILNNIYMADTNVTLTLAMQDEDFKGK